MYGQSDHVRQYGRDFYDRLSDAKFDVNIIAKQDLLSPELLAQLSVECEDEVVIATRRN